MMQLLSEFEIQHLSPLHPVYPLWPGGERWLQLYETSWHTQIVFSKGLNDGVSRIFEIYLETDDFIDVEDFSSSWQANLVYELGKIIPNVHDLAEKLKKYQYLTVQIEMEGAPPEWSLDDSDGNIGLFLGLPNPHLEDFANKQLIPLNLKLMRPQELLYSIENGDEVRQQLSRLYLQQGNVTISNLERKSIV